MPVKFKNSININDQYTLPTQDGSNGQALITDGSGNISFGPVSASDSEAVHLAVKNTSGTTITKGTPVYITGNVGNSDILEVAEADASDATKMPAVGLLESDLIDNGEGFVSQGGYLKGLATATIDGTSTTSNDTVYVKAGGGLTMTKPTGVNYIQNIAKVARVHATNGSLVVSSILRANDVPTPLYIDHTNQRLGIGTSSPSAKLHVSSGTSGDAVVIIESDTDNNNENDNPQLQFKQDSGATIAKAGLTGDAGTIFTDSLANSAYFGNEESAALQLYTDTTARLTIEPGGNVGIGTTNPAAKLQVGDGTVDEAARVYHSDGAYTEMRGYGLQFNRAASYIRPTTDGNKGMYFGTDGATWSIVQFDATQYDFQTNAASRFSIGTDGNATFAGRVDAATMSIADTGTLDSSVKLRVAGNLQLGSDNSGGAITKIYESSGLNLDSGNALRNIYFRINGTEKLKIDTSGNATFAGDVTVGGDLIVNGTTTTLNTTTVEVEDNILQLNTTQGTPDTLV